MSAPAKRLRPRVLREGESVVIRHPGDPVKFRRIAAKFLANLKPRKGVSVARELARSRLRAGR